MIYDLASPAARMNGSVESFLDNVDDGDTILDRSEADTTIFNYLNNKKKKILFINGDIDIQRFNIDFEADSDPWHYIQEKVHIDQKYTDAMKKLHCGYTYNAIFLGGEPRLSRILTMNELHSYKSFIYSNFNPFGFHNNKNNVCKPLKIEWYDDNHIKWKIPITPESLANQAFKITSKGFDSTEQKLLTEEWHYFKEDDGEQSTGLLSYAPSEYWESIIDLVGEAYTIGSSLTEKTFKPLYWKKPFIIIGGPGIHTFLKDNGFELYDEIFDYSFDNEPFRVRWKSIMGQMKNILDMKITDLEKKINYSKLEHNYEMIKDVRSRPRKFTF